jgi:hypothetical protein
MSISAKAIFARFGFDKAKAIGYCESLGRQFPQLKTEYSRMAEEIRNTNTVVLEEVNG